MKTQMQPTLDGIEVTELEVEEIEIKGVSDYLIKPVKPRVLLPASHQCHFSPPRQMVA